MKLKWYVAQLIHYLDLEETRRRSATTDETIVLIRAVNAEDAYKKAQAIGKKMRLSYRNIYGEKVRWRFLGVAGLCKTWDKVLRSGSEIYYEIHTRKDPAKRKEQLIPEKQTLLAFRD